LKAAFREDEGEIPELIAAAVGAANHDNGEGFATLRVVAIGKQLDAIGHQYAHVVMLDNVTGIDCRKMPKTGENPAADTHLAARTRSAQSTTVPVTDAATACRLGASASVIDAGPRSQI
jgi:hypothetical protein